VFRLGVRLTLWACVRGVLGRFVELLLVSFMS